MPIQKTTPEDIIRSSIRVFRKKGYYRTNMSDLAKETGLTKGAFYHHFNNKEEVMRKALQATAGWFNKKVFSIAYDERQTPKERLHLMAHITFEAFTKEAGGCFFANTILETAHVEDTFLGEVNQFFEDWEKALKQVFQQHYAETELEELTQQTIAEIEGSIILMQLHKNTDYLQQALNRIIKRL
ncbi:MAG: TetR/AcrR family transcriptional regulator [Flammeovirgaceae bacterium]